MSRAQGGPKGSGGGGLGGIVDRLPGALPPSPGCSPCRARLEYAGPLSICPPSKSSRLPPLRSTPRAKFLQPPVPRGNILFVGSEAEVMAAMELLEAAPMIGLDLEWRPTGATMVVSIGSMDDGDDDGEGLTEDDMVERLRAQSTACAGAGGVDECSANRRARPAAAAVESARARLRLPLLLLEPLLQGRCSSPREATGLFST